MMIDRRRRYLVPIWIESSSYFGLIFLLSLLSSLAHSAPSGRTICTIAEEAREGGDKNRVRLLGVLASSTPVTDQDYRALALMMKEGGPGFQDAAKRSFANGANDGKFRKIWVDLHDSDKANIRGREAAIFAVRRVRSREDVPALMNLLSRDDWMGVAALDALCSMEDERFLLKLDSVIEGGKIPDLTPLTKLGSKGVATLERVVRDSRSKAKHEAALNALSRFGDPAVLPDMARLARDSLPQLRKSAAHSLGRMKSKQAMEVLKGLCLDGDVETRLAALEAVRKSEGLSGSQALTMLRAAADREDYMAMSELAMKLAQQGYKEAVPDLEKLFRAQTDAYCIKCEIALALRCLTGKSWNYPAESRTGYCEYEAYKGRTYEHLNRFHRFNEYPELHGCMYEVPEQWAEYTRLHRGIPGPDMYEQWYGRKKEFATSHRRQVNKSMKR